MSPATLSKVAPEAWVQSIKAELLTLHRSAGHEEICDVRGLKPCSELCGAGWEGRSEWIRGL